jgi:uncharacterized repeat protein (TIGR01451 family)
MRFALLLSVSILICPALAPASFAAEQHRATRLGNPSTRFAPRIYNLEDLRSRFRDPKLQADMAEVLRQWGWTGNLEDLIRAGNSARVYDAPIQVGETMPFMSSRENGKPICLRNVLWAGEEPAPAYAFDFTSMGRKYRCITPKACSNFFVVDLGTEPVPALAIDCTAPSEVPLGRPVEVCLMVRNPGDAPLANVAIRLPLPAGVALVSKTEPATATPSEVHWQLPLLEPGAEKRFCASVSPSSIGQLPFNSIAEGANVKSVTSSCSTKVIGIPAILIDAVDLEDPIQIGNEVTYEIRVTNQGSSEATNVRLVFNLPTNEEFVSGGGITPVQKLPESIQTDPLPALEPKGVAVWRVVVKATQAGDVRFKIQLTSDQFTNPINEEESTLLY